MTKKIKDLKSELKNSDEKFLAVENENVHLKNLTSNLQELVLEQDQKIKLFEKSS